MLKDKVAIVTGAASGIGLATAEMLAKEGARVVLADINEAQLEAVSAKIGADALAVDLSKREGCRELADYAMKQHGRIDILVNVAGIQNVASVEDFPEERWPDWYGRWVAHPEGRYYRYLRESASGKFVGEIAYHFDGEKYLADVIVYAPYRRRGYGAAGLALLCAAAKENGVGVLYDDIAADNPSVALFLRCGFSVKYRTDQIVMVKKVLAE